MGVVTDIASTDNHTEDIYLNDVLLLCTECRQPIKARITTQRWINCEWIGPQGQCLACYQREKREKEQE